MDASRIAREIEAGKEQIRGEAIFISNPPRVRNPWRVVTNYPHLFLQLEPKQIIHHQITRLIAIKRQHTAIPNVFLHLIFLPYCISNLPRL
jgi:hypothetical protein